MASLVAYEAVGERGFRKRASSTRLPRAAPRTLERACHWPECPSGNGMPKPSGCGEASIVEELASSGPHAASWALSNAASTLRSAALRLFRSAWPRQCLWILTAAAELRMGDGTIADALCVGDVYDKALRGTVPVSNPRRVLTLVARAGWYLQLLNEELAKLDTTSFVAVRAL